MSILDAQKVLSDGQAFTTQTTHDSENVIDMGAGYDAFGNAKIQDGGVSGKLWLNVTVKDVVTSEGSATVSVDLQSGTAADAGFVSKFITPAIAKATLVPGYRIISMPLPRGLNRFLKLVYTVGGAALTAGSFNAWLGLDSEANNA